MTTLAHISDLHFGRIAHPGIVESLVDEVNEDGVDLVVLSGDLTQRARPSEFEAARAMLDRIEPEVLVVPGNHDVYPWWKPIRRLTRPLERYRAYISEEPAPTYRADGVAVLGVNSAYGRTIKNGRLTDRDLTVMEEQLGAVDGAFKVLVLHHHLTQIRALWKHDIVQRAQDALDVAARVGVDLILCGHLHISHIEAVDVAPGRRIVVASAGTATSNRGRRSNRATNLYNRITVNAGGFTVEERRYVPEENHFVRQGRTRFDRAEAAEDAGAGPCGT
jgi:3',5'-cyclic AMP phosphodiesterase CpdA